MTLKYLLVMPLEVSAAGKYLQSHPFSFHSPLIIDMLALRLLYGLCLFLFFFFLLSFFSHIRLVAADGRPSLSLK